jgi:flagellar hook-basal body complex protein FliE
MAVAAAAPPVAPVAPVDQSQAASAVASAGGAGFGNSLAGAVDHLQQVQGHADTLAVQAATGQLQNPQDYLMASAEASLTAQLTVAVRNKAIEAFNDIMRMPV